MEFKKEKLENFQNSLEERKNDRAAWAEEQKALRDQYNQMYRDNLGYINGNSNRMREFLDIAARFHNETVKNMVLIHAQKKDAVCVSPKAVLKRLPKVRLPEKEKAIYIFTEGKPYVGNDGELHTSWNITEAYDVADVSGISQRSDPAERQPEDVLAAMVRVTGTDNHEGPEDDPKKSSWEIHRAPVAFKVSVEQTEPAEFNSATNVLTLRADLSPQEKCEEAINALCHRELRLFGQETDRPTVRDGFIAYCASYLICKRVNLPFSDFELPRESFTASTTEDFEKQVRTICRTSKWLAEHVEAEIIRAENAGNERSAPQQETAAPTKED